MRRESEREKSREEQIEFLLEAKTIEDFDVLWAEMGHEDIKDLLFGKIVGEQELEIGANRPKILELESGKEAVYKPQKRAKEVFPGLQPEKKHLKEWLMKRIEELLGFDVIPQTVIRENGEGVGSVQKFIQGYSLNFDLGPLDMKKPADRAAMMKIAILDFLFPNLDRSTSNLIRRFDDGAILGIDHGDSLPDTPFFAVDLEEMAKEVLPEERNRSKQKAMRLVRGNAIPPDVLGKMEKLQSGPEQKIVRKLFELTFGGIEGRDKCESVLERLDYLLGRKKIPRYLYPEIYERAVPGSRERQIVKDNFFATRRANGDRVGDIKWFWSMVEGILDSYLIQELIQENLDEEELSEEDITPLTPEDLRDFGL
jgi:hypothetical protein